MAQKLPMTVIGGFLGAGKTTLVNHLLRGEHGRRLAILVNDFGDIAIDENLVIAHDGETLTFANGCVCCTLGDNFMRSLDQLLRSSTPPEQIIVEASGVADPRSIADIAVLHPNLTCDLIIVLAAAESVRARATNELTADTVDRQLSAADLLVVNKTDLLTEAEREELLKWCDSRTRATVVCTQNAELSIDLLSATYDQHYPTTADSSPAIDATESSLNGIHDTFTKLTLRFDKPVQLPKLREWLQTLPDSVLRIKGYLLNADDHRLWIVQRSGRQLDLSALELTGHEQPPRALVFVGVGPLPERTVLEQGLTACSKI